MVDNKQQSGFALLISLIVVGAVLSIGLVILDLSIKQVRLATTTKDSEIAFHAANAGMECARFWRREMNTNMITGADMVGVNCFGTSIGTVESGTGAQQPNLDSAVDGSAYRYNYELTWASGQRCTAITTVVAVADLTGNGVEITNMQSMIPGYPGGNTLNCDASSQCTAISVQGYNRGCSEKNNFGTIQREVLLEF